MTENLQQLQQAARTLVLVGGLLALILTPALFLLQTPLDQIELSDLTGVAMNVVLGAVLLAAALQMTKSYLAASLLAFVASLALLVLGGTEGVIAGLFGLFGAAAGAVSVSWDFLTRD